MTRFRFLLTATLTVLLARSPLPAQTWTGTTNGSLSTATNWTDNTLPANDGTAAWVMGAATNYTLTLDSSWSINSLSFTSAATAGYRLNGSGSPTLTVGSGGISDTSGRSLNSTGGFTLALPQAITYHVDSASHFANWAFSGSGGITKTGAGTVWMSSNSLNNLAWSGTLTINAGTVSFNNDNKLGTVPSSATPGLITLNGGTFNPSSAMTINANRGIAVTAASTFSIGSLSTVTYGGIMTGSSALTLTGGTLALSGANTYSGTLTVGSGGRINLGAAATLENATVAVTAGTLNFGVNATTLGALSGTRPISLVSSSNPVALSVGQNNATTAYSGVISNTGSLTKIGTGTLTLSGANTYSGGTTVNGGTFRATNSTGSATGTGTVTVNSGGTLGGTGTISGATTLASGGTISPGNSPGTLATGSQTWAGGANYVWEINDATGVAGTNYDLLSISGTLTLNATPENKFTLSLVSLLANHTAGDVINFNRALDSSYTIATTTGGILGFDANAFTINTSGFTNALAGGTWSLALANTSRDLQLNFTAAIIPEPSTYAALFGALALGLSINRKRRLRKIQGVS